MHRALSAAEQQFIALFFDGDGWVTIDPPNANTKRPTPRVGVGQAYNSGEPPELLYFQRVFGGTLTLRSPRRGNSRDFWELRIGIDGAKRLLEMVADYGVIKHVQARMVLDHMSDPSSDPLAFSEALHEMKGKYGEVAIDRSRLTPAAMAGFFAAEGSVGMYKATRGMKLRATISQYSCNQILDGIAGVLGFGFIVGKILQFSCGQTVIFLRLIAQHIPPRFQKHAQVELALAFVESRTSKKHGRLKRTQEQTDEMECTAKRLKEMKKL